VPVSAYSAQFVPRFDPAARHLLVSPAEGAALSPGNLVYTVGFSEPMLTANLVASAFSLKGLLRNIAYSPQSFSYNGSGTVLTITYAGLPEDNYTLTFDQRPRRFSKDAAGKRGGPRRRAGLAHGRPTPPANGTAGGNFFVDFSVDIVSTAYPTPPDAAEIRGEASSTTRSSRGLINNPSDTDSFTVNLDAGQNRQRRGSSHHSWPPAKCDGLWTGQRLSWAAATAPAPGSESDIANPLLSPAPARTLLPSRGGTIGLYTLQLVLNAALDAEGSWRRDETTRPASAQNIDSSFISLGGRGPGAGAVLAANRLLRGPACRPRVEAQ